MTQKNLLTQAIMSRNFVMKMVNKEVRRNPIMDLPIVQTKKIGNNIAPTNVKEYLMEHPMITRIPHLQSVDPHHVRRTTRIEKLY